MRKKVRTQKLEKEKNPRKRKKKGVYYIIFVVGIHN
jgi:hypothetical protein